MLQKCLTPPLTEAPGDDDDWFCPPCVQVQLLKGAIVAVHEPVGAGADGRSKRGGRGRASGATTTRTRYLALTDEVVASLPAPPALVSSDEDGEGNSDEDEYDAISDLDDDGSGDDDDPVQRSRKRARPPAKAEGDDPALGYFVAHRGQALTTSGSTLVSLPTFDAPGVR